MRTIKRLPMRMWIKEKLDNAEYPGMRWVDKDQGKFEVSWKHGSLQSWRMTDLTVFKEWATYTGKYRPQSQHSTDETKRWKTNFRCALNALPEIQQVREESNGRGVNAKKVYIMNHDKVIKKPKKPKDCRKQMKTDLAPCDREIIEIVDSMQESMQDDYSWTPLLIKKDTGLPDIQDLTERGLIFNHNVKWQGPSLVTAI